MLHRPVWGRYVDILLQNVRPVICHKVKADTSRVPLDNGRVLQSLPRGSKPPVLDRLADREPVCVQAEEKGYSLALDSLIEAERRQALEAADNKERCRKSRDARTLQDLQQQMAEKITAQAEMQVCFAFCISRTLQSSGVPKWQCCNVCVLENNF